MNNRIFLDIKKSIEDNNLTKAEHLCLEVYNQNSADINAIKNLALVYMLQKKYFNALKLYKDAIKANNEDFDSNINLAYLYKESEDFEKAITISKKASQINENSAMPHKLLGEIYLKLRKFEKSLEHLREAKANLSKETYLFAFVQELNFRLLEVLNALNLHEEAKEVLEHNLSDDNLNPDLMSYQIRTYPNQTNMNLIEKAIKFINDYENCNDKHLLRLAAGYAIALGYHYENINNLLTSESYFIKGNKLIEKVHHYRPLESQRMIKNIINSYNKLSQLDIPDTFGKNMIFIVGMPRSGTTLLESIVANSPDIATGGELSSFKNLVQFDITTFSENNKEKIIAFLKNYQSKMNFIMGDKKFLIDKLPFNIFLLGFINKLLPTSKILIINREPWANALSLFKTFYLDKHYYSSKFFNIAMQIANFNFAKKFWISKLNSPMNIFELNYEDLVANPIGLSSSIYNFLGIKHKLDLENRKRFYSNTASFNQVKKEIAPNIIENKAFGSFKEQFFEDLEQQQIYWKNSQF